MEFVLIKTFGNYIEANIALSLLQQENINCHIEDENTLTIINMASGMRLMVHESQLGRAREILLEAEKEYLDNIPCPKCHQKAGFQVKLVIENHAAALKEVPFGGFISFLSRLLKDDTTSEIKHFVCNNCHTEFGNLPPAD